MQPRRGLGLALVGIVACVLVAIAAFALLRRTPPDAALSGRLAAAVDRAGDDLEGAAPIRLADLTDFEWDTVHVIAPYSAPQDVNAQLGFTWRGGSEHDIGISEGVTLLVFVKDGAPVRHIEHPRNRGDLAELDVGPLSPDDAVFTVQIADRGEPWRVLHVVDADGR